jgi:AcrR family transcriptional regulator
MPSDKRAAPRRGTRPANRRELILVAARELFYRRGYDHVGVGDIADAVAIGPSALYRHFNGKQQLLADVLEREHDLIIEALDNLDLDDREQAAAGLAGMAMEFRGASALIQREARHLPEQDRAVVRSGSRDIGQRVGAMVQRLRPDLTTDACDLLAWAVVGVVGSPAVHRLDLPRDAFEALIGELVSTVIDSPIPPGFEVDHHPREENQAVRPHSRRENLMSEAVKLFASRGYANIAVEDVGATLGISGPSVYNHFPAKLDLLQTPMVRGINYLTLDLIGAFDGATTPHDVLHRLIRSHVAFALSHPYFLELLFTEVRHLPDEVGEQFRRAQREYVQEWGDLLHDTRPGLDIVSARIRVQAAITMVGDVVRVRHLRQAAYVQEALVGVCDRLLL